MVGSRPWVAPAPWPCGCARANATAGSGCAKARPFSPQQVLAREPWLQSCCASSSCWVSWDSHCGDCSGGSCPGPTTPRAWMEEMDHRSAGESRRAWKGLTRAKEERGMKRHVRIQVEFRIRVKRIAEGRGGRKMKGRGEGQKGRRLKVRWLERGCEDKESKEEGIRNLGQSDSKRKFLQKKITPTVVWGELESESGTDSCSAQIRKSD